MKQFTKTFLIAVLLIVGAVLFAELVIYLLRIVSEALYKFLLAPSEVVIVTSLAGIFLGVYLEFRK